MIAQIDISERERELRLKLALKGGKNFGRSEKPCVRADLVKLNVGRTRVSGENF